MHLSWWPRSRDCRCGGRRRDIPACHILHQVLPASRRVGRALADARSTMVRRHHQGSYPQRTEAGSRTYAARCSAPAMKGRHRGPSEATFRARSRQPPRARRGLRTIFAAVRSPPAVLQSPTAPGRGFYWLVLRTWAHSDILSSARCLRDCCSGCRCPLDSRPRYTGASSAGFRASSSGVRRA